MDVKILLRAIDPISKRYILECPSSKSLDTLQSRLLNRGLIRGTQATTRGVHFYTGSGNSKTYQYHTTDTRTPSCHRYRICPYQQHQLRYGSTLNTSNNQLTFRDRPSTLTESRRYHTPNHHRTQKSSLVTWRQKQNNRLQLLSKTSKSIRGLTSNVKAKLLDEAPFPAASLNRPQFSNLQTENRIYFDSGPPLGRRRRRMASMHRLRLQRSLKRLRLSMPRHSSQLLGFDYSPNSHRPTRKVVEGKWTVSRERKEGLKLQYHHIHYYRKEKIYGRRRYLGFQGFLKDVRKYSVRGRLAFAREKEAMAQYYANKRRKSKYSMNRPLVRRHLRYLDILTRLIKAQDGQNAIQMAKILFKRKGAGVRLPEGSLLLKIVKFDQQHYLKQQTSHIHSEGSHQSGHQHLERLSVEDINTILEHCHELQDRGNGMGISTILINRYRSKEFDFNSSDPSIPNSGTIHWLFSLPISLGELDKARQFIYRIHKFYPYPIPIDIYTHSMKILATIPGQIPLMNTILTRLHNKGPPPTTTIYNTILEAHGRDSGIEAAESFLRRAMMENNYTADQQSFRILIQASLKDLDLSRAHYWLGEYSRQGFEITPKMMEPFMRCCVQQLKRCSDPNFVAMDGGNPIDIDWYSREWKQKTLQLVQFITNQRIRPTAVTFELLIEGLLSQGDISGAKKVLSQMRGSSHLYTPAPKTWEIFFHHYLSIGDPMSALRTLNEMRDALMQKTFHTSTVVVPSTLYHQLFRYLLHRGNLKFAERSLYELMINQDRRQPTESEVINLIWKMDRDPEGAQRVYELLYSHARRPGFSSPIIPRHSRPSRKNRILEQGPIQMANVGLMRAKAKSHSDKMHQEVWSAWKEMTSVYLEDSNIRKEKEKPVLGHAFLQLARASRKLPSLKASASMKESNKKNRQGLRGEVDDDDQVTSGWDFGQVRRSFSSNPGLGLNAGKGPSFMNVRGKNRMFIQQLFQRNEFIKPLLDRHEVLTESRAMRSTLSVAFGDDVEVNAALRLQHLKENFDWMNEQRIPITIGGFNQYINTLISHGEIEEARIYVEKYLLPSDSEGGDNPVSIFHTLNPTVDTIEPFYGRNGQKWEQLVKKLVKRGGHELRRLWRIRREELHKQVRS